jgi:hypothetical protein
MIIAPAITHVPGYFYWSRASLDRNASTLNLAEAEQFFEVWTAKTEEVLQCLAGTAWREVLYEELCRDAEAAMRSRSKPSTFKTISQTAVEFLSYWKGGSPMRSLVALWQVARGLATTSWIPRVASGKFVAYRRVASTSVPAIWWVQGGASRSADFLRRYRKSLVMLCPTSSVFHQCPTGESPQTPFSLGGVKALSAQHRRSAATESCRC